MQNWTHCSPPSANCRFEWLPAPDIALALVILGLGGGAALCLSDMPRALLSWIAPLPLLVMGLAARRWLATPPRQIQLDRRCAVARIDGRTVTGLVVDWRCGVAVLRWQWEGGRQRERCVCLPWRLDGTVVRELRRWPSHSQGTTGVAP